MSEEDDKPSPANLFGEADESEGGPAAILRHLLETVEQFKELRIAPARFFILMRHGIKVKAGKTVLGTMSLPRFGGPNAELGTFLLADACGGDLPDFILTLSSAWWETATPRQREALVFHELCHCAQAVDRDGEPRFDAEGLPVWDIRGHDIEEFGEVVRRYGAWLGDVQAFADSLAAGGVIGKGHG